jgi:predicted Co/Zn/Cd cation transporter (cation efflux family)
LAKIQNIRIVTVMIGAVYALTNTDLRFLMDYINPAYVAATSGYLLKAGVENYQKIKNNSTDQKVNL